MLTEQQKQFMKQQILELVKQPYVTNDTTGYYDWLKQGAYNIEHNLPVDDKTLERVYFMTCCCASSEDFCK